MLWARFLHCNTISPLKCCPPPLLPRVRIELEDVRNKGKDEEDVSILPQLYFADALKRSSVR